jgi:hypothetical protein
MITHPKLVNEWSHNFTSPQVFMPRTRKILLKLFFNINYLRPSEGILTLHTEVRHCNKFFISPQTGQLNLLFAPYPHLLYTRSAPPAPFQTQNLVCIIRFSSLTGCQLSNKIFTGLEYWLFWLSHKAASPPENFYSNVRRRYQVNEINFAYSFLNSRPFQNHKESFWMQLMWQH